MKNEKKIKFFHFPICKMYDRCYITLSKRCWRDGRAVEGAALEMLFRRNLNASSNLALSAILFALFSICPEK